MILGDRQWPWFAVFVKTCSEKSASMLLENSGYECFLPTSKCVRRWSDRSKVFEVPLFPGYIFCRMNPHNRLPVLKIPGVIQIVGTGTTPIPVDEEEIDALRLVASSRVPTMPWPYLQVGHVARIEEGPLRGMTGIIIRVKSALKFVLSVSLLQRSVAVEVDRAWISAIPGQDTHPAQLSAPASPEP